MTTYVAQFFTHKYLNMEPSRRYRHHGILTNAADPKQPKCDYCKQLFATEKGLINHQSRDTAKTFRCHRLQTMSKKELAIIESEKRKESIKIWRRP